VSRAPNRMTQTPRTIIRPWNRYDDERSYRWPSYNDPYESIWNLQRAQSPFSGTWFNDMISSRRHWAVDSRNGELMGRISLREIDNAKKQARLGITFSAAYVGRGLGTEAMQGFLDVFFGELGFVTMVLDVAAVNERAVRSYRSLGFLVVDSDWRTAYYSDDLPRLDNPVYAHLAPHIRPSDGTVAIEFFEMQLHAEQWRAHRAHQGR
jgi:RimJ/RimL family protein N-acetyltransferase